MAGLAGVLRALARVTWRDVRKFESLTTNQFFWFALFFMQSGGFLPAILALIVLFPLSEDPLRKVPPDRLMLWPFDRRNRVLLRLGSVWLSPAVWITAGVLVYFARAYLTLQFIALALAFHLLGLGFTSLRTRAPSANLLRYVPPLPGLVRKNIREMMCLLDFYCALILSIAGAIWRFTSGSHEAGLGMTTLVLLALSTYAQSLFGPDGEDGLVRYRLLPMRGWRVLAAKDAAFLIVAVVLTLALEPLAGLSGALVALAVGHHASVLTPRPQPRWRFTSGTSVFAGVMQVVLMASAAVATVRLGAWIAALCALVYLGSVVIYGRSLDRAGAV